MPAICWHLLLITTHIEFSTQALLQPHAVTKQVNFEYISSIQPILLSEEEDQILGDSVVNDEPGQGPPLPIKSEEDIIYEPALPCMLYHACTIIAHPSAPGDEIHMQLRLMEQTFRCT